MHPILLLVFLAVSLFYALFKYMYGLWQTPDGMVFLGTVHHPTDYFIYLSEIAQGKTRWFSSEVLQSADVPFPTLVRWVNVFWGHIWSLFGLGPIAAYQATNVLFTVAVVALSYLLAVEVVGKKIAPLTLLLYLTEFPFPAFTQTDTGYSVGVYDFWYIMGNPFNRFNNIPHHLIGSAAVLSIILVTIWWQRNRFPSRMRKRFLLLVPPVAGFALGGINAVHLIFTLGILGFSVMLISAFHKPFGLRRSIAQGVHGLMPVLLAGLGGLPIILHLKQVLSVPPYSQMISWEATHQLYLTVEQFIYGYGPVMLAAPIGLVLLLQKRYRTSFAPLVSIAFTVAGIGMYFSHLPESLSLGKVRFLLPVMNLFLCSMGALAIVTVIGRLRKIGNPLALLLGILYAGLTLPSAYTLTREAMVLYQDHNNANYYLQRPFYEIIKSSGKTSDATDIFLIQWPFNTILPGITGRRTYFSEALLANNAQTKSENIFAFFSHGMTPAQMRIFLKENRITRVIGFSQNLPSDIELGMSKLAEKNGFAIWKVDTR
jgi:hypothetical protein